MRKRHQWLVGAFLALNALSVPNAHAQTEWWKQWERLDSVTSEHYADVVFDNGPDNWNSRRLTISFDPGGAPYELYSLGGDIAFGSNFWRRRVPWNGEADSITVIMSMRVHLPTLMDWGRGVVPHEHAGQQLWFLLESRNDTTLISRLVPEDSEGVGSSEAIGPSTIEELQMLNSCDGETMFLRTLISHSSVGMSGGSERSFDYFRIWNQRHRRFELSRVIPTHSSIWGSERLYGTADQLDTTSLVDVDADGCVEVTQRRRTEYWYQTAESAVSDPGIAIYEFSSGAMKLDRFRFDTGDEIQLIDDLPVLILPEWNTTETPLAAPTQLDTLIGLEMMIKQRFRRSSGLQIGSNTCNFFFEMLSDSVLLDCSWGTSPQTLVIWFASDTPTEAPNLLIWRSCDDTTSEYQLLQAPNPLEMSSLRLLREGRASANTVGTRQNWELYLQRDEIHFDSATDVSPRCRIAIEILDREVDRPYPRIKAQVRLPRAFTQADRETWTWLVLAERQNTGPLRPIPR